jgi:hypothetical protein
MELNQKATLVAAIVMLAISSMNTQAAETINIPGYVVHGINNYNGKPIINFANASPSIPYLNAYPPVNEIGVYQEGASVSGTITAETNRALPVATTRSFFDYFNPRGEINLSTVNVPLGQVGTNVLGPDFTSLNKRVIPTTFSDAGSEPSIHRKKGIDNNPTVGEWEKISGKLSVVTDNNGKSTVLVTIRDAFPNAVYTLWDLGTLNPLTSKETGYAVPLGGIPNIIVTDKNGCASMELKLSYDLTRQCKVGATYCSSYVSAFYNWDAQAYGASAAATWAKAPTGIYGGNQMIWPMSGDILVGPQKIFTPSKHGCN